MAEPQGILSELRAIELATYVFGPGAALCRAEFFPHPTRAAAFNPLVNHYVTREGR